MKLLLLAALLLGFGQAQKQCVSTALGELKDTCALFSELQNCQTQLAACSVQPRSAIVYRNPDYSDAILFATDAPKAAFASLVAKSDSAYTEQDSGHTVRFSFTTKVDTVDLTFYVTDDQSLYEAFALAYEKPGSWILKLQAEIMTSEPSTVPTTQPTTVPTKPPTTVPTKPPTTVPTVVPTAPPTTNSATCVQRKALGQPSGTYQVASGVNAYCFMEDVAPVHTGGGWTVIMKMAQDTAEFGYFSNMWTSSSTTLNTHSTDNSNTDFKSPLFNTQQYTEFALYLPDWQTAPNGYYYSNGQPTTAYSLFNGPMKLLSSNPRADIPFNTDYFSYQSGYKAYGINLQYGFTQGTTPAPGATFNGYAIRWGATFNNQGNYGSNDSGNGAGFVDFYPYLDHHYTGFVDWVFCCHAGPKSAAPGYTRVTPPGYASNNWTPTTQASYRAFIMAR